MTRYNTGMTDSQTSLIQGAPIPYCCWNSWENNFI